MLPLGVYATPEQWDPVAQSVRNVPNRAVLNSYLLNRRMVVSNLLLQSATEGKLVGLRIAEVKRLVEETLYPETNRKKMLVERFRKYIAKSAAARTRDMYSVTLRKILKFEKDGENLAFEDITKDWLTRFDRWLAETGCPAVNSRAIHLRNIRAVFNDAIDDNITTWYPFRHFKIRYEETVKRALSVQALRKLFALPVEPWQERYLDCFKLSFFLIGINLIDLLNAKPLECGSDRLTYRRAKTRRLYDIKVEPEALAIINKYAGCNHLVCWGEGRTTYKTFLITLEKNLKLLGTKNAEGEIVPAFPTLTTYVARHSWATIAAELDIPKETIAAALGHGGNTVTDIYINFNMRKVDAANRKVLDYVLYDKE